MEQQYNIALVSAVHKVLMMHSIPSGEVRVNMLESHNYYVRCVQVTLVRDAPLLQKIEQDY